MATTINLTSDIPIVSVVPSSPKPQRPPPKCGYCGIRGHTVRTCNDPETMNTLRELRQRVNRFPAFVTIIDWLQTIDVKRLQIIVSKYTYTAYKKYSKEMCINILCVVIAEQYRMEERYNLATTQEALQRGNILIWTQDAENIPQLYMNYCAQFMTSETNPDPTEAECVLLYNVIHTRNIPTTTPYHIVKRFYNFILYRYMEYTRLSQIISTSGNTKYIITRNESTNPYK